MERDLIRVALREALANGKSCQCGSEESLHTIIETVIYGDNPEIKAIIKCSDCITKDGGLASKTEIDEKAE